MIRKLKENTAIIGLVFTIAIALLALAMTGVAYINPDVFSRMLLAHKKMIKQGGTMKVIHVGDLVMEVMKAMGFADILTIE